ncbi:MAG: DUF1499 domain-containing protein [Negativicutes bacterium]
MKTIIGVVVTGIILLVVVLAVNKNSAVPSALGVKEGALAPLPDSPNAVSSQTDQAAKRVAPFPYSGTLDQTKALVKKAAADFGGAQIMMERPDYLHMVFTVPFIPFKDDVEFFFSERERVVHYRSASRVGYSDLGVNRKRYERLRSIYEQAAKLK